MNIGSGISLRRDVQYWVHRQLGSIEHEQRVARIAATLFDLTRPLHGLTPKYRQVLLLGALTHDVGRAIRAAGHEKHGARMVLRDGNLDLSHELRGQLAFLTRYHKGAPPVEGKEGFLGLRDDRRAMRLVLALLRAADTLDSRSLESPRLVLELCGREIRVTCRLEEHDPRSVKVYGRRKKFRLLEALLDCRVRIDIRTGQPLQRVA